MAMNCRSALSVELNQALDQVAKHIGEAETSALACLARAVMESADVCRYGMRTDVPVEQLNAADFGLTNHLAVLHLMERDLVETSKSGQSELAGHLLRLNDLLDQEVIRTLGARCGCSLK